MKDKLFFYNQTWGRSLEFDFDLQTTVQIQTAWSDFRGQVRKLMDNGMLSISEYKALAIICEEVKDWTNGSIQALEREAEEKAVLYNKIIQIIQ